MIQIDKGELKLYKADNGFILQYIEIVEDNQGRVRTFLHNDLKSLVANIAEIYEVEKPIMVYEDYKKVN